MRRPARWDPGGGGRSALRGGPTCDLAESGVPGFQTTVWFGLFGPANMPPEVVAKIHADVTRALDLPQTREFFEKNSFERVALIAAGVSPG